MLDRREVLKEEYKKAADEKNLQAKKQLAALKVHNYYKQERAEERTARCRTMIDYATSHNNRRLKTFGDSCYGNDNVAIAISNVFNEALDGVHLYKEGVDEQRSRTDFINQRIFDVGPIWALPPPKPITPQTSSQSTSKRKGKHKLQFTDIPNHTIAAIEDSSSTSNAPMNLLQELSRRSRRMKYYFQSELSEITKHTIERITHDFTKRDLFHRLQVLNEKQRASSSMEKGGSSSMGDTSNTSSRNSGKFVSTKGGIGQVDPMKPKSGGLAARCKFKYPEKINEKPMEWLFEDDAGDAAFR